MPVRPSRIARAILSTLSAFCLVMLTGALAGCVPGAPRIPRGGMDPEAISALIAAASTEVDGEEIGTHELRGRAARKMQRAARIELGVTSRAEVEAFAGAPEFVMPTRNVAVYPVGGTMRPAFSSACELRKLYIIQYSEDIVAGVWRGHWGGDLVPANWTVETLAGLVERSEGWTLPDQPMFGSITTGTSRRADVEAILGEPYYVIPKRDRSVYLASAAPEERDDEVDCAESVGPDGLCPERIVVTGRRPACSGTFALGGFLVLIVRYDEEDRVVRAQRVHFPNSDFRLDAWAASGG